MRATLRTPLSSHAAGGPGERHFGTKPTPGLGAARGYRVNPPGPSDATDHERLHTPDNHQGMHVIPTMILFGLVLGRWWRPTLLLAAIVWPAILIAAGLVDVEAGLLTAAGLGALNAAVGILLHQAVLGLTRLGRRFTAR